MRPLQLNGCASQNLRKLSHEKHEMHVRPFWFFPLALLVAVVGLIAYNQSTSQSTYVDRRLQVSILVKYDVASCSSEKPIRVTISNSSDKTLQEIEWSIAAFVPGRSTDIMEYQSPYRSPYIYVEPGKAITLCYITPALREPQDPTQLRYVAKDLVPDFQD